MKRPTDEGTLEKRELDREEESNSPTHREENRQIERKATAETVAVRVEIEREMGRYISMVEEERTGRLYSRLVPMTDKRGRGVITRDGV